MLARLDRWIHGFLPASPDGLALARVLFAGFFLVTGIPTFSWEAGNPPAFYNPPPLSLAALAADFPPAPVLHALDLAMIVLLVLLLVGWRTRATSLLLTLVWIVGNSFRFSFGKIDHTIMGVVTPAVMAFSGWGARLSIDAKQGRTRPDDVKAWPLALLALLLAFGFFSAGVPKALAWADFDLSTQGARSWLVSGWYELDRRKLLAPFFMRITSRVFWEGMDLTAVAFELGFLFALARRSAFRIYLFVAVMFHFMNLLMLNIVFMVLLPVYIVLAPWERLTESVPAAWLRGVDRIASRRGLIVLLFAFVPLAFLVRHTSTDLAAAAFSHFGLLAERLGATDVPWAVAEIAVPLSVLAALVVAGLPRPLGTLDGASIPGDVRQAVFFDGVCNLCNGFVNFTIARDQRRSFSFGSLQSETGALVDAAAVRARTGSGLRSILLADDRRRLYAGSYAVLKVVARFGGAWRLAGVFWLVPRPFRELAYAAIARSRYRIFGRRDSCRVPTPEERALFI